MAEFKIKGLPACLRQGEIGLGKLYFDFTCSMGKPTKCSILNNIKQDYLDTQIRSAFVAIK